MSLQRFWNDVRAAFDLRSRRFSEMRPLDAAALESSIAGGTAWLTPDTAAGFDEADFAFLPDKPRAELGRLAAALRRIAETVPPPPVAPPSTEQLAQARPLLRDIAVFLDFHRYADPEAFRIGKQIEQALVPYRPERLVDLRFATGPDHAGDPGLWVMGVFDDDDLDSFLGRASKFDPVLSYFSRQAAPERFPYTTFRSATEQRELLEENA